MKSMFPFIYKVFSKSWVWLYKMMAQSVLEFPGHNSLLDWYIKRSEKIRRGWGDDVWYWALSFSKACHIQNSVSVFKRLSRYFKWLLSQVSLIFNLSLTIPTMPFHCIVMAIIERSQWLYLYCNAIFPLHWVYDDNDIHHSQ